MPRNPAPTLAEIAADYALWGKYFDVDGLDSPEQWEALGQAARVQMLRDAFDDPHALLQMLKAGYGSLQPRRVLSGRHRGEPLT